MFLLVMKAFEVMKAITSTIVKITVKILLPFILR